MKYWLAVEKNRNRLALVLFLIGVVMSYFATRHMTTQDVLNLYGL